MYPPKLLSHSQGASFKMKPYTISPNLKKLLFGNLTELVVIA